MYIIITYYFVTVTPGLFLELHRSLFSIVLLNLIINSVYFPSLLHLLPSKEADQTTGWLTGAPKKWFTNL